MCPSSFGLLKPWTHPIIEISIFVLNTKWNIVNPYNHKGVPMKVMKSLGCALVLIFCVSTIGSIAAHAEVVAYDANGQFLGILQLAGNVANIYIPSLDRVVKIDYLSGEVSGGGILLFNGAACFGDLAEGAGFYMPPPAAYEIIRFGISSYYTGERVAPQIEFIQSQLFQDGVTCIPVETPQPPSNPPTLGADRPTVPAFEIQLPFTTPVALPLRFEVEPTHPGKWEK